MNEAINKTFAIIAARYVSEILNTCEGWTAARAYESVTKPLEIGKRDKKAQLARMRLVLTVAEHMYAYAPVRLNQPKRSINKTVTDARKKGLTPYDINLPGNGSKAA